jgi:hypothetical protein
VNGGCIVDSRILSLGLHIILKNIEVLCDRYRYPSTHLQVLLGDVDG